MAGTRPVYALQREQHRRYTQVFPPLTLHYLLNGASATNVDWVTEDASANANIQIHSYFIILMLQTINQFSHYFAYIFLIIKTFFSSDA